MNLKFDPKCGFMASSLILCKKACDRKAPPTTETVVLSMIDINLDKLLSDFNT